MREKLAGALSAVLAAGAAAVAVVTVNVPSASAAPSASTRADSSPASSSTRLTSQKDFAPCMDWLIATTYGAANHRPNAAVVGSLAAPSPPARS